MLHKLRVLLVVAVTLALFPASLALAQGPMDLPPGSATQAEPLLEVMQQHMQDVDMSSEQRQMMMADMRTLADLLPPGTFLRILELMLELDMQAMMDLHQAMHNSTLLEETPGEILIFVQSLI